jgi:hypothetical protein
MVYLHENGTVKPVAIVSTERRGMRENDGGDESNQSTL